MCILKDIYIYIHIHKYLCTCTYMYMYICNYVHGCHGTNFRDGEVAKSIGSTDSGPQSPSLYYALLALPESNARHPSSELPPRSLNFQVHQHPHLHGRYLHQPRVPRASGSLELFVSRSSWGSSHDAVTGVLPSGDSRILWLP